MEKFVATCLRSEAIGQNSFLHIDIRGAEPSGLIAVGVCSLFTTEGQSAIPLNGILVDVDPDAFGVGPFPGEVRQSRHSLFTDFIIGFFQILRKLPDLRLGGGGVKFNDEMIRPIDAIPSEIVQFLKSEIVCTGWLWCRFGSCGGCPVDDGEGDGGCFIAV